MKSALSLIVALLFVAPMACLTAIDEPQVEYRHDAAGWPCEPNCPDPQGECFGECIGGAYCDAAECCVDPDNCVCYVPDHPVSIALCSPSVPCEDCFGECVGDAYCDGPACCIGDDCVCHVPEAPISQILCGGDTSCFGECLGGAYCDVDPECCIDPDNCLCYAPDHPVSQLLCDCTEPPTRPTRPTRPTLE